MQGKNPPPQPQPTPPPQEREGMQDCQTRITHNVKLPLVARSTEDACLVQIYPTGPDMGRKFELRQRVISIGRGPDNDLVIDKDSVSRRHVRIENLSTEVVVADLGSTNGTYINDSVVKEQTLRNGDLLKIGDTIFKFLSGGNIESDYHEAIYRMTIVDGLTDIHNKRYLDDFLDRELARCRRYNRPLTVAMTDIDRFKAINDTHGHLTGDFVLKELSRLVKKRVRREELFARYGGEEFCLVLPETDRNGARALCEQIRQMIETHAFTFEGHKIEVTVSVGIAELERGVTDALQLLKRADENLYRAKRAGRNRVVG
jgi:two-component system cell cycle response regulator